MTRGWWPPTASDLVLGGTVLAAVLAVWIAPGLPFAAKLALVPAASAASGLFRERVNALLAGAAAAGAQAALIGLIFLGARQARDAVPLDLGWGFGRFVVGLALLVGLAAGPGVGALVEAVKVLRRPAD